MSNFAGILQIFSCQKLSHRDSRLDSACIVHIINQFALNLDILFCGRKHSLAPNAYTYCTNSCVSSADSACNLWCNKNLNDKYKKQIKTAQKKDCKLCELAKCQNDNSLVIFNFLQHILFILELLILQIFIPIWYCCYLYNYSDWFLLNCHEIPSKS